ncbi:MAG: hypothetical protein V3S89_08265 [Desulfobacterales bacterium]
MDITLKNTRFNYQFDFEIGYLVKSPCKNCDKRTDFPECSNDCMILDGIHTMLAEAVSCTTRQ